MKISASVNRPFAGFTLIEIIIVVAIIGFLSAIAIPLYQNLAGQSQQNATKAGLGAVRSTLALRYAATATGGSNATFPTSLASSDFAAQTPPYNALNDKSGVTALTTTTAGTTSHASVGFWYVSANNASYGRAGAYSDDAGSVDTANW